MQISEPVLSTQHSIDSCSEAYVSRTQLCLALCRQSFLCPTCRPASEGSISQATLNDSLAATGCSKHQRALPSPLCSAHDPQTQRLVCRVMARHSGLASSSQCATSDDTTGHNRARCGAHLERQPDEVHPLAERQPTTPTHSLTHSLTHTDSRPLAQSTARPVVCSIHQRPPAHTTPPEDSPPLPSLAAT